MTHESPPAVPAVGVPTLEHLLALRDLGLNLAPVLRDGLAAAVRAEHARDLDRWPVVGPWRFDGRIAPSGHAVIVLLPSTTEVPVGPGRLSLLPAAPVLPLPPTSAHEYARLRGGVGLPEDAAVFVVPLRVASDDVERLWVALTEEDRASLDRQIACNVEHHRALLDDASEPAFAAADWRTLSLEERSRHLGHALTLISEAEAYRKDPPSWRKLAREFVNCRPTLRVATASLAPARQGQERLSRYACDQTKTRRRFL